MKTTKYILKWSIIVGLFIVPFIAFIVPNNMFFPFIVGKGFAFRILVEIISGLFLVLAVTAPEYRPKISWITKTVVSFALVLLIADLMSANVYKSLWSNYERMEGFVLILHLALYYIVASSLFRTERDWRQFLNVSIMASVIMSFYGALQLLGKIAINQGGVRVDGTFGNASYFAVYLVLHIFLCLYMLSDFSKTKWQKWAYGLVALFETYILYFTATRGAILGLIGGLLLSAALIAWKERENLKLRKVAYGVLGATLIFIAGFWAVSGTSFVKNSPVLSRFSSLSFEEFQTQGRYFIWPMAVKGVLERPIFGWGQESFNYVFNKYYDPQLYGQEEWFDRTHNVVLDWLIAAGFVGFLSYVAMYIALLYYVWRKKSTLNILAKSIFTGMFFASIFHNIFVFDNLISYILFFSFMAYIHAITVEKDKPSGVFYTGIISKDIYHYVLLPVVITLTFGGLYLINVPAILANYKLISAIQPQKEGLEKNLELFKQVFGHNSFGSTEAVEQLISITSQIVSSPQVPNEIKQKFYDLAEQKIVEKVASTPRDARYLVFAGNFFNRFGNYDEAIKYLTRALVESPKKQSIYFELGTSYLGKGDRQKTFDLFKQAYDLNRDSMESKIIYAVGAIYTKNIKVLNEIMAQIDKSIIISDNRFLKAYADIGDYPTVVLILSERLAKEPTNVQTKLSLASAYASSGQKQKAISLIREIMVANPDFKTQGEQYIKEIQG